MTESERVRTARFKALLVEPIHHVPTGSAQGALVEADAYASLTRACKLDSRA